MFLIGRGSLRWLAAALGWTLATIFRSSPCLLLCFSPCEYGSVKSAALDCGYRDVQSLRYDRRATPCIRDLCIFYDSAGAALSVMPARVKPYDGHALVAICQSSVLI
jgi:hypothetical protein